MSEYRVFHLVPRDDISKTSVLAPARDAAMIKAATSGDVGEAISLGLYREAGRVDADRLAEIFGKTNHVDGDWTKGPDVILADSMSRSTSVGDILWDKQNDLFFSYRVMGLTEITGDQARDLRMKIVAGSLVHGSDAGKGMIHERIDVLSRDPGLDASLDRWRESRREMVGRDLGELLGDEMWRDEPEASNAYLVYGEGFFIGKLPDERFSLLLGRDEFVSTDLPLLEAVLFDYALSEGWVASTPEPEDQPTP